MIRWLLGGVLGLACVALPWCKSEYSEAGPAKDPVWLSDLAQAREQARQTGKPLFVVFRCVP